MVWFYPDVDGMALLCKIRRIARPADLGMKVFVYDATPIRLVTHGLLNSIVSDPVSDNLSGREKLNELLLMRDILEVPDHHSQLVKNAILKSNPDTIDESYFEFAPRSFDDEIVVEATDAFNTAFRIFGIPSHEIPDLREHQILDFDLETMFSDAIKTGATPDGKHFFEYAGRRLYLHKVDRTLMEQCLGVDLIYNFIDQRRLVFVQYKCQKSGGKYYLINPRPNGLILDRFFIKAVTGLVQYVVQDLSGS